MGIYEPTFDDLRIAYRGYDGRREGRSDDFVVMRDEKLEAYVMRDLDTDLTVFAEPFDAAYPKLAPCVGHAVGISAYGQEEIYNYSIECFDCNEVIYDVDTE